MDQVSSQQGGMKVFRYSNNPPCRLVEELEPVGFGIATVHTEHEKELARKVGAKELPHMILLLDRKVMHYKDPQFSAVKAIEFIRRKFPYRLVEIIDRNNVDAFLAGWMDNRVRVLYFGHVSLDVLLRNSSR